MHDEAHIRLVDSHAEGHRRDHDHVFGRHKFGLRTGACLRLHACMIKKRPASCFCDLRCNFLGAVTRLGVDYACSLQPLYQGCDAAVWGGFGNITDVGPIKTRHHHTIAGYAQLFGDVVAGVGVCGRGQRQPWHFGKVVKQRA